MEVIDLAASKPVYTMTGFKDAQGALYVPESNLIFISDGALGVCNVYDGTTYKLARSIDDLPGADNIRYDGFSVRTYGAGLVHVAYRHGLRALDCRDEKPVFDIPLDTQSESFQFEAGTGRIFTNLPTLGYVAVANAGNVWWLTNGRCPDSNPSIRWRSIQRTIAFSSAAGIPPNWWFSTRRRARSSPARKELAPATIFGMTPSASGSICPAGKATSEFLSSATRINIPSSPKFQALPDASTSFFVPDFNRLYAPSTPYAGQPSAVQVFEAQPWTEYASG